AHRLHDGGSLHRNHMPAWWPFGVTRGPDTTAYTEQLSAGLIQVTVGLVGMIGCAIVVVLVVRWRGRRRRSAAATERLFMLIDGPAPLIDRSQPARTGEVGALDESQSEPSVGDLAPDVHLATAEAGR